MIKFDSRQRGRLFAELETSMESKYDILYRLEAENHLDREGYEQAIKGFEALEYFNSDFVGAFCRFHGDMISSDREAAAFFYAFSDILSELLGLDISTFLDAVKK